MEPAVSQLIPSQRPTRAGAYTFSGYFEAEARTVQRYATQKMFWSADE